MLAVARNPDASVVEIADTVEITERSAYRVLADLQQAGYVRRSRKGRHNRYEINRALPLGDPTVGNGLVGDLLKLVVEEEVEGHLLLPRFARSSAGERRGNMPQLSGFRTIKAWHRR
jgi:DNA-binding transcriptional ArsR family regulator